MPRLRWRCGLTVAVLAAVAMSVTMFAASSTSATAQSAYPSRPITLVVPLPAGGTADILARIAAEQIRAGLGQPVVVENRAGGAGGLVGMEQVFKAAPDGYTLICGPQLLYSIMNTLNPRVSFDIRKFEPVSILADYPAILLVRKDLPVNSVPELIAYAKANPGKLTYGSQGLGQIGHLSFEQLRQQTGIEGLHVPFRGSAPAVAALAGGQIDVLFDILPTGRPLIEGGQLKMIGIAGSERLKAFPNVPTIAETLPGFEADTWMGVAAPPGTPAEIVTKLSEAIGQSFRAPALNARIAAMDIEPRGTTPEQMRAKIEASAKRWVPVIQAGKITVE